MNYKKTFSPGLLLILIAALLFIGCERRDTDTRDDQIQPTPLDTPGQQTPGTTDIDTQQQQAPDLTGEWTGDFGDRRMTLTVKSQDGNTFEGETVVRWDSPKREKITGEVNFDTREMKITETAGTRNHGNFTGTVSADMTRFTGVWRDNGNRQTYNVSLTKK
jgi:hypothetical protein